MANGGGGAGSGLVACCMCARVRACCLAPFIAAVRCHQIDMMSFFSNSAFNFFFILRLSSASLFYSQHKRTRIATQ